jgi:tetratricopeptide (TPR) repeat protein
MQRNWKLFTARLILSFSCLLLLFLLSQTVSAQVTVSGTVYDSRNNALAEIDVELLDNLDRTIGRTRTDASGRYEFSGLKDGRYSIRVFAFRYDLQDETHQLDLQTQTIRGTQGPGFYLEDFHLVPKKGGLKDSELSVVFAQNIPKEAQTAYEKAVDDLSKKKMEAGITNLSEAIRIFPDYYLALTRMGQLLFSQKRYLESVRYFLKAADVNPKSATSFYYLGSGLHNSGAQYNKAARTALQQALILAPASVQILYVLGKVERAEGFFTEAETHLLKAKKLSTTKIPEIHKELAQLYGNDLKKYSEAADELELYMKASNLPAEEQKKIKSTIANLRTKAKAGN